MKAERLLHERHQLSADSFAELRIWRVPHPVRGSSHDLKYALAYVVGGVCVLRYDNEAGKGDHRHIGGVETAYAFETPGRLLADFWKDVDQWRPR
jgi:Family of unknown function (DUF6516)